MSRYSGGWGHWGHRRPSPASPYASVGSETMPSITDEDFTYITSEDILNHSVPSLPQTLAGARRTRGRSRPRAESPPPEDDVLIIKNKGITYPAHFDAYSIFDGHVRVRDVQEKIGEMMELSERATRDVKLLYKGRNLSEIDAPVKQYGVKNNSEILAVVRDITRHRDSRDDGSSIVSSTSSEDVIVATDGEVNTHRKKKKKSKRRTSPHVHHDGHASNLSLPNFVADRPEHTTAPLSPTVPQLAPSPSLASAVPGGPLEKLDMILAQFEAELVPMCNEFMASPPTEAKKLEDEHRKLTETIFQQVLLKLDEVDTGGDDDARARRRQLVKHTQEVLKMLDDSKAAKTAT